MRVEAAALALLLSAVPASAVTIYDDTAMVFFDRDEARLSDSGRDTLREKALVIFRSLPSAREIVTGYCDSAETECAALARRRAEAVKAELVRLGIPRKAIKTTVSTDLMVPTGPGVSEPQNRRVTVAPL